MRGGRSKKEVVREERREWGEKKKSRHQRRGKKGRGKVRISSHVLQIIKKKREGRENLTMFNQNRSIRESN
jgi:hypothetical protein